MAPLSQELEPPANPGRFIVLSIGEDFSALGVEVWWLWGVIWEFLTTGWDASKVIQIGLAIAGTSFGAVMAWRNAEERVLERLKQFLLREERRVEQARAELLARIQRPHIAKSGDVQIFSNNELRNALHRFARKPHVFGRRSLVRAERELAHVVDLAGEKIRFAEGLQHVHQRQYAAAHLILGALADARSENATAWNHFEAALKINPNDVEALEYAGIQLLKLANAEKALEYFTKLLALAERSPDKMLLFRTLRNQANAHERQPRPQLTHARDTLLRAVAAMPDNVDPREAAAAHEALGNLRRRLNAPKRARNSFTEALRRFATQNTAEGTSGVERMNKAIKFINRELERTNVEDEVEVATLALDPKGQPPS